MDGEENSLSKRLQAWVNWGSRRIKHNVVKYGELVKYIKKDIH